VHGTELGGVQLPFYLPPQTIALPLTDPDPELGLPTPTKHFTSMEIYLPESPGYKDTGIHRYRYRYTCSPNETNANTNKSRDTGGRTRTSCRTRLTRPHSYFNYFLCDFRFCHPVSPGISLFMFLFSLSFRLPFNSCCPLLGVEIWSLRLHARVRGW